MTEPLLIAKNNRQELYLLPQMAARYALVLNLNEAWQDIIALVVKIADAKGSPKHLFHKLRRILPTVTTQSVSRSFQVLWGAVFECAGNCC